MPDIQSATAEIRQGKNKEEEETGQKYNVRICYTLTQGGHKYNGLPYSIGQP